MTREEAVNELNDRIELAKYVDSDYIDYASVDAVKMAISALSVPETNVGDTIGKQAAIDAILALTNFRSVRALYEYVQWLDRPQTWSSGINDAIDAVIGLPSAQQWIPIEDRPPEFGKDVLISHRGFVSIDWLTQSEGDVYFFASRVAIADIDAWMPLPMPFREGEGK